MMEQEQFQQEMKVAQALVEHRLQQCFTGKGLEEAMRYSLLAGGKRIRPILTMKFCEAAGGKMEDALDFGCGLEMLHTYSLIHDDLPCMDDDDLRRGKPTCHKVYGECVATLAGDALQAAAFDTVLSAPGSWSREGEARAKVQAAGLLARAAGNFGMCAGQYADTLGNGQVHTAEELTEINDKKTGALLRAACMIGVAAASGYRTVSESCMEAARVYATNLGLAFQIRDDMLDVVGDAATFGKPIGSDREEGKMTFVDLLGLDGCTQAVQDYTDQAKRALGQADWIGDSSFLQHLADSMAVRER